MRIHCVPGDKRKQNLHKIERKTYNIYKKSKGAEFDIWFLILCTEIYVCVGRGFL